LIILFLLIQARVASQQSIFVTGGALQISEIIVNFFASIAERA